MNEKKNIYFVKDRHPRISEVLNDCVGNLCVVTYSNEPLSSILKKICGKINAISYKFVDSQTIQFLTDGVNVSANYIGPSANTIYTADDSLTGDRIVDLNGHVLQFANGGNSLLTIHPTDQSVHMETAGGRIIEVSDDVSRVRLYNNINNFYDINSTGHHITADKFFLNSTLGGTSTGYVWTLQNTGTGEGAWADIPISPNTLNATYKKSDGIYTPAIPKGGNIVYHEIEAGGLTDGILSVTKGGAMSTATITKVGNFDKIAVTGGTNSSILTFNDKYISDTQAVFKLSVKVENLNADGSSGTSKIGLGTTGVANTGDTGSTYGYYQFFDLIGKTGVANGANGEYNMTVTSPTGTLVSNGEILDIEFRNDLILGKSILYIVNRNTGAFTESQWSPGNARITTDLGLHMGVVRLMLTNATYTILSYKVVSDVPKNPVMHVIGDSLGVSFNTFSNQTLYGKVSALTPMSMIVSNGNGTYWKSMATIQLQDIVKIQAKYVLVMSILPLNYNSFDSLDADYPAFIANFNTVMGAIVAYGGVPIITKWGASNFYGPTLGNAWNSFLNAQKAGPWPQIQFLDLTQFPTLDYGDFFGHLTSTGWNTVAPEIIKVLKTLGY